MADILDFHQNAKAHARWSNMERVKLVEKMLAEEPRPEVVDTAPSELSYGHQDGDVA